MAAMLSIDGDSVAGKLIRVWVWASRNCNGDGVTNVTVKPIIDRCAGVTGFANTMIAVGWLEESNNRLTFPNFHRHCSQTAKERANTNRRVSTHRKKCNAATVTNVTPSPLQKPLPEKRREEKSNKEEASLPFVSEKFKNTWKKWETHRIEKKQRITPTTRDAQLSKLAVMGEVRATAALENSMENGYTGIFEPVIANSKTANKPKGGNPDGFGV